jgi:hypothetical protein
MAGPLVAALAIGAILWAGGVAAGTAGAAGGRAEERAMPAKTIEEALREHTDALMAVPGVVGVAQGLLRGKPCIRVFVAADTPELRRRIPRTLEGYPVVVEASGEIRARPERR